MKTPGRVLVVVGFAMLLWLPTVAVHAQYQGDLKAEPYVYEDIFPLMGKKLAKRGVKFPLPWGVGLNYMFMQQPIDINRIALGVNDSGMVDMSEFIKFKSVDSQVHALNLRLDLWLFPFLSIYALANYSPLTSTDVTLSEPFVLEAGAEQWVVGSGFGMTAAMGVFGFWATFDVNFSWNHAEKLDDPVRSILLSPRIGKAFGKWGKWGRVGLNLWVGAMCQIIGAETSGSISLAEATGGGGGDSFEGDLDAWYDSLPPAQRLLVGKLVEQIQASDREAATIHYDLDKSVAYQWNMLLGTQVEISERWFVRAEVGFIKRESLMLGFNYRFGTPGFP